MIVMIASRSGVDPGIVPKGSCRIDRQEELSARLRLAIFLLLLSLQLLSLASCTDNRASSLKRAQAAIDKGDPEQAETILLRSLKRDPRDVLTAVMLGNLLFSAGRLPEAHEVMTAVPEDARSAPGYRILEARILVGLSSLDLAADRMAGLERAGLLQQAMLDELFRAIALRPDLYPDTLHRFRPKWRSGLLDLVVREGLLDGAATLAANLELDAETDQEAVKKLAMALSMKGQDGQAFRVLTSIPIDPSDPDFVRSLVRLHIRLRHFGRAAKAILGVKSVQDREELQEELLLAVSSRMEEARRAWRNYPSAWRAALAGILMDRSELAQAAAVLRTLPSGSESREQGVHRLLLSQLSSSKPVLLDADDELLGKPLTPEKLIAKHRALTAAGRWDLAAATEEEFVARFPDHPGSFDLALSRARRLVRSGRYREGLVAAKAAIRLDPTRAEPLIEEGLALRGLGRKTEADATLRMALLMKPGDPGLREFLGLSSRKGGDQGASFSLHIESAAGDPARTSARNTSPNEAAR